MNIEFNRVSSQIQMRSQFIYRSAFFNGIVVRSLSSGSTFPDVVFHTIQFPPISPSPSLTPSVDCIVSAHYYRECFRRKRGEGEGAANKFLIHNLFDNLIFEPKYAVNDMVRRPRLFVYRVCTADYGARSSGNGRQAEQAAVEHTHTRLDKYLPLASSPTESDLL